MTTSSRFTVRIPRVLRAQLLAEAERRGITLNALVTTWLQQAAEQQASRNPEPLAPTRGSLLDSVSADAGAPTARSTHAGTAGSGY
jgi:hypothetical protein